jgi:hypothetical protein
MHAITHQSIALSRASLHSPAASLTAAGLPADLYHQDHFAGAFSVKLPELVNNTGHTILGVREEAEDAAAGRPATTVVSVEVQGPAGVAGAAAVAAVLEFHLRREMMGFRKGALLTYMIKRPPAAAAAAAADHAQQR